MGFPSLGVLFGGSRNEDYNNLGSIDAYIGVPLFWETTIFRSLYVCHDRSALDIKLRTEYLDDFDVLDVEDVTDFVSQPGGALLELQNLGSRVQGLGSRV